MDYISNFLTSVRNAEMASHTELTVPSSKMGLEVARILKENGIIADFSLIESTPQNRISIQLNMSAGKHHYKRISKPGRRVYTDVKNIPLVLRGLGMVILSTPKGLLTGKQAKKQNVGGEILCEVY